MISDELTISANDCASLAPPEGEAEGEAALAAAAAAAVGGAAADSGALAFGRSHCVVLVDGLQ